MEDVDYLRILEGGNFINFVAMVIHKADKLSVVKTNNFRLKASESTYTYMYMYEWVLCVLNFCFKVYYITIVHQTFRFLGTGL